MECRPFSSWIVRIAFILGFPLCTLADTEAELLAAVRANPSDNTPRLKVAQFLRDKGGEANVARAEFIELGIQFAATPYESRTGANASRLVQLRNRYARQWLPEALRTERISYEWDRGFVSVVELPATLLESKAVRDGLDSLDGVDRLEVKDEMLSYAPKDLVDLLNSLELLTRIRSLSMRRLELSDDAVRGIHWKRMKALEILNLEKNKIARLGLETLLKSGIAPQLRELNVANNLFGTDGLRPLIGAPLTKLERLDLSANRLSDLSLLAGSRMPALRSLDVSYSLLDDKSLSAFFDTPVFYRLRQFVAYGREAKSDEFIADLVDLLRRHPEHKLEDLRLVYKGGTRPPSLEAQLDRNRNTPCNQVPTEMSSRGI